MASFNNASPTIFRLLKFFDAEVIALARKLPNAPVIDDSLPLDDTTMQAAMEADEEGVLGALIHTTYLLRTLATGMLPETCVLYTERFGKQEIPFEVWVNQYRIEQDDKSKAAEEWKLDNATHSAEDCAVKPSTEAQQERAVDIDSGEGSHLRPVVRDEGRSDTLGEPSPISPAHSPVAADRPALVDYGSSPGPFNNEDPPPATSRSIRAAKLSALASKKTRSPSPSSLNEEQSPQPPQLKRRRRLSKRHHVDADFTETENDTDDDEAVQLQRRKGKGKALADPQDGEDDDSDGGRGPLQLEAKRRLDALMAKLSEDVEAVAREYGKPPEMCYKYVDGMDGQASTRSVTNWNIWQQWYAVHGEQKKPTNSM